MARTGVPHKTIAMCVGEKGINERTLRRHFRLELEVLSEIANAMIAGVLYNAAARGEARAVCFWLKCQARWQERHAIEHSGEGGGPAVQEIVVRRLDK
jgi:hypothetical protein